MKKLGYKKLFLCTPYPKKLMLHSSLFAVGAEKTDDDYKLQKIKNCMLVNSDNFEACTEDYHMYILDTQNRMP